MRKFIIRTIIFLIPLLFFLIVPASILKISKENFSSIDEILTNSKGKYLIGYAYNEDNYNYLKWAHLNLNTKKNIWALGSSRVLQFRENMFDSSFYNAGYTILSINDFRPFLNSINRSKYPKYIILGLDQWMFNPSWGDLKRRHSKEYWEKSFSFFPKSITYVTTYKDLFLGKLNLKMLQKDDNSINSVLKVGLNAKINNKGFRNDGSIYYGNQIVKLINVDSTADDYKYRDTYERIKNGNGLFQYGNSVNVKALLELDELLKYCRENQIQIIAFLPPFADGVYKRMTENGNYGYLKEIYIKIKPLFDKYEYEIYDFSTVSSCNSSDIETIDGFHGGELTYQRLLIKMLDSGSILNQVTNINRLKNELSNNKNNYIIYE